MSLEDMAALQFVSVLRLIAQDAWASWLSANHSTAIDGISRWRKLFRPFSVCNEDRTVRSLTYPDCKLDEAYVPYTKETEMCSKCCWWDATSLFFSHMLYEAAPSRQWKLFRMRGSIMLICFAWCCCTRFVICHLQSRSCETTLSAQ